MSNRITSLSQVRPDELARETVVFRNGDEFLVTELTGAQKSKWERENTTRRGGKVIKTNEATMSARLFAVAVIDDNGDPIGSVEQWQTFIKDRGAADVAKLEGAAYRLAGAIADDDADSDAEGNS